MEHYDYSKRNTSLGRLDVLSHGGLYCAPYKDKYIDANTVNLNLSDTIYRIFSFDKLLKTLNDSKLCLVRPHLWQDPYENFFLNSKAILEDGTPSGLQHVRDNYYGQCWTLKQICDGLWRNYKGAAPAAVKVKTTVEKLMNEVYDLTNKYHQNSYFAGKVNYVADSTINAFFSKPINLMDYNSGIEFAQTLLIKRLPFSYEEEVRVIFGRPKSDEIVLEDLTNPWDDTDLFFVNINPNTLFEEIEFDPWLSKDDCIILEKQLRCFGYQGNVRQSELYDRPEFISTIKL